MAVDEKRRLIYELLVEARDLQKNIAAQKKELENLGSSFTKVQSIAKTAFKAFGAGIALNFIKNAVDEMTKFSEQVRVLGVSAGAASRGFSEVQNVAFSTGQSVANVADVYKSAIEVTQALGQSQREAAALTDAFTRSAVAEGKTAADAARQLETLGFAYERGSVKVKEFQSLLKENEALQQAAEQALGKSTEQLLKMAEAGEIGRRELTLILEQFKRNAADLQVNVTFDRVIESLVTLGKTFVTTLAQASGFDAAFSDMGGLKQFLDIIRSAATILGNLVRIMANVIQQFFQYLGLIKDVLAGTISLTEAFKRMNRQHVENFADISEAARNIGGEFVSTPTRSRRDPSALTPSERAARYAEQVRAEAEAAAKAAREAEAKEAERERKAEAKRQQRLREQAAFRTQVAAGTQALQTTDLAEGVAATTQAVAESAGAIVTQYSEIVSYQERNAQLLRVQQREQDNWFEANKENLEMLHDATDVLANAFYDVFTGATRSAKEFFREVIAGLARMMAARVAQNLATSLLNSFGGASAKGNVFSGGNVVPFARGGIVGGPTLFGMSGGRTGLMGEAGAEAIMPLRRMADGRLGVSAGKGATVQIVNNTGVPATARVNEDADRMQIVLEAANMGARMAERRINRSLRTGYGDTAQSLQRTYGLPRRF